MAGDLYMENIGYDEFNTLQAAGAVVGQAIYHADKSWNTNKSVLDDRLAAAAPSARQNLPAHGYVTFNAANRHATTAYAGLGINKAKLNNLLTKVTRPLGLISANANLAGWPGADPAAMLLAALNLGNVIIEYYKYDGSPILYVKKNDWATHDE